MAVVTAEEVTRLTSISADAPTIDLSGLIPIVEERITDICNHYFVTDIYTQGTMTFNATARTIVTDGDAWTTRGFAAGDEINVYNSYRNDGNYDVLSVSSTTMTLATGETVVDELSGRSILISLVRWPQSVKYAAVQMVKFDYDDRKTRSGGLTSRSLGPLSESYGEVFDFGYPGEIIETLTQHRVVEMR